MFFLLFYVQIYTQERFEGFKRKSRSRKCYKDRQHNGQNKIKPKGQIMIYDRIISIRCDIWVPKAILMQSFIDLSYCTNTRDGTVMYVCQKYRICLFFLDFPIEFWKCSNGECFFFLFCKESHDLFIKTQVHEKFSHLSNSERQTFSSYPYLGNPGQKHTTLLFTSGYDSSDIMTADCRLLHSFRGCDKKEHIVFPNATLRAHKKIFVASPNDQHIGMIGHRYPAAI